MHFSILPKEMAFLPQKVTLMPQKGHFVFDQPDEPYAQAAH